MAQNCSQADCTTRVYATDRHEPFAVGDAVYCARHCNKADCDLALHAGYKADLAEARRAACSETRTSISATQPDLSADWTCRCGKNFFQHPAGSAASAGAASAAPAQIPTNLLSGLSTVLSRAVDAITRPSGAIGDADDSRSGGKASDWGLDPTMFAAHNASWSPEFIATLVLAIKAESSTMAQIDDRIRLAAARRSGNANILGSDIVETVPITSHTSIRSLTYDARLCAATPSSEVKQIASLLSVQRCVTGVSAPPARASGAGEPDPPPDAGGDALASALNVPADSVRDGGTGDVPATTLINRVALSLLDGVGRTRLLAILELIARDHRGDAVHWVLIENGKHVIVPWVIQASKVLLASHIMYLRRLDSDYEHPELPDILVPSTRPRRSPWPLRPTPAPLNIIGDIIDLALVDCVSRSPKGSSTLGLTPVAMETAIRHWLSRWYAAFVTKGSNADRWKALPHDVLANWQKTQSPANAATPNPRNGPGRGGRGGTGNGGRGGNPLSPATPSPAVPSPAATGTPLLGKRGLPTGGGNGNPADGGAGNPTGGNPTNPSKLRFTKCHWKGCTHVVPQDIVSQRGGVASPLCPKHKQEYAAMVDADKAKLRAELAAAGIPLGD